MKQISYPLKRSAEIFISIKQIQIIIFWEVVLFVNIRIDYFSSSSAIFLDFTFSIHPLCLFSLAKILKLSLRNKKTFCNKNKCHDLLFAIQYMIIKMRGWNFSHLIRYHFSISKHSFCCIDDKMQYRYFLHFLKTSKIYIFGNHSMRSIVTAPHYHFRHAQHVRW